MILPNLFFQPQRYSPGRATYAVWLLEEWTLSARPIGWVDIDHADVWHVAINPYGKAA